MKGKTNKKLNLEKLHDIQKKNGELIIKML
jgi:hypothetical protein